MARAAAPTTALAALLLALLLAVARADYLQDALLRAQRSCVPPPLPHTLPLLCTARVRMRACAICGAPSGRRLSPLRAPAHAWWCKTLGAVLGGGAAGARRALRGCALLRCVHHAGARGARRSRYVRSGAVTAFFRFRFRPFLA
jgi:hypothetical protein